MAVRIPKDDAFRLGYPPPKRPSKYRNRATTYNGVRYSSRAEAERAAVLDEHIKAGLVAFWIGQPKFRLGCPENVFVGDFLVVTVGAGVRVEDVKGMRTSKFERDVKLWRRYGPCCLWIVSRKGVEIINREPLSEGGFAE